MAERNPVEIAWTAVKSEVSRATLIQAFAALEAEGFRIVDTENVTEEMVEAEIASEWGDRVVAICGKTERSISRECIRAALLAAPKYGYANG